MLVYTRYRLTAIKLCIGSNLKSGALGKNGAFVSACMWSELCYYHFRSMWVQEIIIDNKSSNNNMIIFFLMREAKAKWVIGGFVENWYIRFFLWNSIM